MFFRFLPIDIDVIRPVFQDPPMSPLLATLAAAGVIATAVVTGFFVSYAKKSGENLATKEDLKNLVEQVKAVTQATKEIEARISGDLWDKQKRWELKRDILLDTAKALNEARLAASELGALYELELADRGRGWDAICEERQQACKSTTNAVLGRVALIETTCSFEVCEKVHQHCHVLRMFQYGPDDKSYVGNPFLEQNFLESYHQCMAAIRNELGMPEIIISKSGATSASVNTR
jgi:hypothetical protein